MDLAIAGLVCASALLHPFWNALIKQALSPERSFFTLALVMGGLGLGHALYVGADIWGALASWPLLLISYAGQLVYGFCLVVTLKRGDLSTYYPIIRASPLFIVVVGFLILGERYPAPLLIGIGLVVAGGFVLQYRRGSRLLSDPLTLSLALLAMAGTGIYSLADGALMRTIEPSVLLFWVETAFALTYGVYLRRVAEPASEPAPWWRVLQRIGGLLLPGAIAYTSYYLILYAYQLGGDVAAVTAVRQISIVASVLIGGLYLREGAILRRLAASCVLATGIVVIVTMS